jgi:hypothetical protein
MLQKIGVGNGSNVWSLSIDDATQGVKLRVVNGMHRDDRCDDRSSRTERHERLGWQKCEFTLEHRL